MFKRLDKIIELLEKLIALQPSNQKAPIKCIKCYGTGVYQGKTDIGGLGHCQYCNGTGYN